ncbi:MAG: SprT family zinc-dependent metalloprotease [Pseudomonadota bacterium]
MSARRIRLGSDEIAYRLTRSARRRTIGLKVGGDGLTVVLPEHVREREAERAVREKQAWILSKLRTVSERPLREPLRGVHGEVIAYLGAPITLRVEPGPRARTRTGLRGGHLVIELDERLDGALRSATVVRAVKRWRRSQAQALFEPKLHHYADQLGARLKGVLIREQKARWGSCSSDGVIRLNARLLGHDEALIDYVCAHEACHLIEMNHGPRFHALLERLIPAHRERSRALKAAHPPGAAY